MTPFATEHEPCAGRGEEDHGRPRRDRDDPVLDASAVLASRSPTDAARAVTAALRRCRQPVPARVTLLAGRPARVTTDRRGFAGGVVRHCAGPWRTSGAWWNPDTAHGESCGYWNREEWDVALGDGAAYRIFRDNTNDVWFIDAIVD
jgi:hypothetical protein